MHLCCVHRTSGHKASLLHFSLNTILFYSEVLGTVQTTLLPHRCVILVGTGTVTTVAPTPSAVSDVLKSPNMHDLQVYGVILTVVLCLIVFGGVKIINKVSPAFLIPVIVSLFSIFIGIFTARGGNSSGMTSHLHVFSAPLCCFIKS